MTAQTDDEEVGLLEKTDLELATKLYCILYQPGLQFVGAGTFALVCAPTTSQAFLKFNSRFHGMLSKISSTRIAGIQKGSKVFVQVHDTYEHVFTVKDTDRNESLSFARKHEAEYVMSDDLPSPLPVWMARNYENPFAPFCSAIFCAASTAVRARELVASELRRTVVGPHGELAENVEFDLYMLRPDTCSSKVFFSGLKHGQDEALNDMFQFVGNFKECVSKVNPRQETLDVISHTAVESAANAPTPSTSAVSKATSTQSARGSNKRKQRSTSGQSSAEQQPQKIVKQEDVGSLVSTGDSGGAHVEPLDQTDELLKEMHDFLATDEAELIPTTKRASGSSSKSAEKKSVAVEEVVPAVGL